MRRLPIILVTAVLGLSSFALQAGVGIADKHTAKSIPCEGCHGPDKGNPATPALETCAACHPLKALTEKTTRLNPRTRISLRTTRISWTVHFAIQVTLNQTTTAISATSSTLSCLDAP